MQTFYQNPSWMVIFHYLKINCLLFLFIFSPLIGKESYKLIPDEATLPLLNPSLHDQKIEKIELLNGLQAVLVSDPNIKQSAVALTVMAGSWQEPDEFPGLAHFLEHMLFMGTTEYPDESSFTRFLTEHGGQTNAFTHGDYTSYMFALNTEGFPEGLKRFASFFKTPLFNPSGVSRELNAIDQEFLQGFNSEDVRQFYVLKQLASPLHPFSRFQAGNSKALAKASTNDLKKWFEEHYSSNLMRLYILSAEPIDELRKLTVDNFSQIPNRNLKPFQHVDGIFTKDSLGSLIRIEPKNATQSLILYWEVPAALPLLLDSRPTDLFCAAFGYEGKDSLLAELKREDLADGLACGAIDLASMTYLLGIEIQLTAKGLKNTDAIIERVFGTLRLISENPFPAHIYDDFAEVMKQRYQFQQREEPFEWAMAQAPQLAQEPIPTYPELTKTLRIFNQKALNDLMVSLTPENALYILISPSQDLPKKEPWMDIAYGIEKIPGEKLKAWKEIKIFENIKLPQKNPFLSHKLTATKALVDKNTYPLLAPPQAIQDDENGKIYYAEDPFYQVPRTQIIMQIQTPLIQDDQPKTVVMADFYVRVLKDALRDVIDEAQMADLEVLIDRGPGAIQITLEGFTESLKSFFPYLIPKLSSIELTSEKFELFKDSLLRNYEKNITSAPYKQTFDRLKSIVLEKFSNMNQKFDAGKNISYEEYLEFQKKLFQKTFIKGLITGSISKEDAKKLITPLNQALIDPAAPYYAKVKTLNEKNLPLLYSFDTKAEGNGFLLVIEMDPFTPTKKNAQTMLSQVMSEAYFTELRTNQQTGYIVFSDSLDMQKHLYSFFTAQSANYTPLELLFRTELFIETYLRDLNENISEERFESLKNSLIQQIKTPPSSLKLFGESLFKLAFDIEDFSWNIKRLDDLENFTYSEFKNTVSDFLSRKNKERIALLLKGQQKEDAFEYKLYEEGQ